MKIVLSLLALTLSTLPAQAATEISLACVAPAKTDSGMIVRKIIVGESEGVTLQDSRGQRVEANNYAVVIELVASPDGAREEFEVLADGEFTFERKSQFESRVTDLKNDIAYVCGDNGTVDANPALSRTN